MRSLMVLEPVYEPDFLDGSYGFRPGRSAPRSAGQSLWQQAMDMGGGWIVDVDIRKFFDTRILILLLKTQLLELAGPELLEQGDRLGLIGEQVQVRLGIEGDLDCTIVNPIIDPVR